MGTWKKLIAAPARGYFTGLFAQKCSQILLVFAELLGKSTSKLTTALAQQAVFFTFPYYTYEQNKAIQISA